MGGMGAAAAPAPEPKVAEKVCPEWPSLVVYLLGDDDDEIDPDIRELGDYFNIEERWVVRLNEAMKFRVGMMRDARGEMIEMHCWLGWLESVLLGGSWVTEDSARGGLKETKGQDLEKLYEVLEKARSPTGLLTVQIGKMECGQFVGKIKPDKDVERMARKFKLDDPVTSRLTELKVWRKRNGEEERATKDLERIEYHLRFAKRPNALCTLLVGKLLEGEVDELPDLTKAEKVMQDYKLDEDACCKMREIIEKRVNDEDVVLTSVRKHLNTAGNASSMLCKIARQLMDGEILPDPPERPPKGGPCRRWLCRSSVRMRMNGAWFHSTKKPYGICNHEDEQSHASEVHASDVDRFRIGRSVERSDGLEMVGTCWNLFFPWVF
ncbi:Uncharacterized protein SCF082_LOCUS43580 [Durusdinium trenchii]|uniref:Uncharacterized protein n=1 Tax=Durusdinium trenchii TaxID=1381693 RepID=A0ABP0QX85_9DINO